MRSCRRLGWGLRDDPDGHHATFPALAGAYLAFTGAMAATARQDLPETHGRKEVDGATSAGRSLDLYYRLAHAAIALPPLRQRGEDIELLARHFLDEACAAARRQVHLSPAAVRRLTSYSWPGNVRQLRSVLKRVVLLSADGHEVTPEALQLENAEVPTSLIGELEQAERRRVREALAQARGSQLNARAR